MGGGIEQRGINEGDVAVATTNYLKFARLRELATEIGVGADLSWFPPPPGVEELVARSPKDVGIDKLWNIAWAVEDGPEWEKLGANGQLPDWLLVMDVLAVAQIDGWDDKRAVMKKPELGQTAMSAFTGFFAECLDHMRETSSEELKIAYYLIQAVAPIDKSRRRVKTEETRVEWDEVEFTFSLSLVKLLADPGALRLAAKQGVVALEKLLGSDTVTGFRIQSLIPELVRLAAVRGGDELWIDIGYAAGTRLLRVDQGCDLRGDIMVGVEKEKGTKPMRLLDFMGYAVKNVTSRLLWKIFMQPK